MRARKKEMGPRHGRDRERECETENERDRTETCVTERERKMGKRHVERERKEELSLIVLYSCIHVRKICKKIAGGFLRFVRKKRKILMFCKKIQNPDMYALSQKIPKKREK